jgi:hypothetical protein
MIPRAIPLGILGLSVILSGVPLNAQPERPLPEQFPATGLHHARSTILFERNLNTFNWLGALDIDTTLGSLSLKTNDQYSSNIILVDATSTSPERRLQSNRHSISLLPAWRLTPNVSLLGSWSSLVYSDAKAVGLSTASFHNLYGGAEYSPIPGISVSPLIGYRWDNQGMFEDQGMSYDFGAQTNPRIQLDGYQLTGSLRFNKDQVEPRVFENHLARAGMQKVFAGATRDSLEFQFTRNRREFYAVSGGAGTTAAIDTNIESRVDDIVSVANLLDYEIAQNIISSFFIGVSNRTLDKEIRYAGSGTQSALQFGTAIEEFDLSTFAQGLYRSTDGTASLLVRFQYNERNETHSAKPRADAPDALFRTVNDNEKTKDNLTRRTVLSGHARFPLSFNDDLDIAGSAGILRYDTPHLMNVEDRDEQLFALGITTSHHLSQYLFLAVSAGGSTSHIVYLSKDRSANNNINRVLRLAPRVVYRPFKRAVTSNTFEVLANYTVYDFEEQAALIRSFSYRQFSWLDSTTVPLTARVSLDFLVYLKLYERGQLKWNEFTERTENAFTDETYAVQARFEPNQTFLAAAGVRYFSQSRYIYEDAVKQFDSRTESFGPTCTVQWKINRYGMIDFSGWYERRRHSAGSTRTLPNMALNIQLTF